MQAATKRLIIRSLKSRGEKQKQAPEFRFGYCGYFCPVSSPYRNYFSTMLPRSFRDLEWHKEKKNRQRRLSLLLTGLLSTSRHKLVLCATGPTVNRRRIPRALDSKRPRKDERGVDLISEALPFGGLWYLEVRHAVGYAQFQCRSHDAVIRVYDAAGNVIETHEHAGGFK